MHLNTLLFVGGVAVGILAGDVSLHATEIALGALFLFILQCVIATVQKPDSRLAFLTAILCIGIFIGVVRVQFAEEKVPFACAHPCTFEATVVRSPELKNGYQEVIVKAEQADETVLYISVRAPMYPARRIGEQLRITGQLREPNILYPHGNRKLFDYENYLRSKHVGSEMLYPKLETIDSDAHTFAEKLGRWKENLVSRMNMFVSSPASTLASGMLFGNSSMPKELVDTFRAAGLSHIVVLSGFNIAIVIAFVLVVFAFLPHILRITLASLFVVMFVMMVGGEASVVRATLMAFIALLASLMGREYIARQALLISFLLIILYEPFALLHDVSLHLSFLATAGIVYGSEPVARVLKRYVGERWLPLFTTTIAAYAATLPFICYAFGTVSAYALLANVLVIPAVPIAMLLSFLTVASSYAWDGFALAFGYVATMLLDAVIFVAEAVERMPFSYLAVSITFVQMCIAYGLLAALCVYLSRAKQNETRETTPSGMLTDVISY